MDRDQLLTIRSPGGHLDPVVKAAMERLEERYRDARTQAAATVEDERHRPTIAQITEQLDGMDLQPDERAALQVPGVYDDCLRRVLAEEGASATDMADHVRRLVREGPRRELHELVLDRIGEDRPHLRDLIAADRDELLGRLDDTGLAVGVGQPRRQVVALLSGEGAEEDTAQWLRAWAQSQGVPWTQRVSDRMVADLRDQDVNAIPDAELLRRWRHALKAAEPIAKLADRPDCDIYGLASFKVPVPDVTRPEHLLDPEAVKTVAAVAYVHTVGEEIGAFDAANLLARSWAGGRVNLESPVLFNDLYCLYKREDVMPEAQRFTLYRRVLGIEDDRADADAPANVELAAGWNRLVQSVVDYLTLFGCEGCDQPAILEPIAQSTLALQSVISENLTGLDVMQSTDLYLQLQSALQLLDDREVVEQLSGGRPGSVWAVIPALLEADGRPPRDVLALHDQALARQAIFAWVAAFRRWPGIGKDHAPFQNLLRAVAVLRRFQPPVSGRVLVAVEGNALAGGGQATR